MSLPQISREQWATRGITVVSPIPMAVTLLKPGTKTTWFTPTTITVFLEQDGGCEPTIKRVALIGQRVNRKNGVTPASRDTPEQGMYMRPEDRGAHPGWASLPGELTKHLQELVAEINAEGWGATGTPVQHRLFQVLADELNAAGIPITRNLTREQLSAMREIITQVIPTVAPRGTLPAGCPIQYLEELELLPRTYNALHAARIFRLEQLIELTADELLDIDRIGPNSVNEIRTKLVVEGHLYLKGEQPAK